MKYEALFDPTLMKNWRDRAEAAELPGLQALTVRTINSRMGTGHHVRSRLAHLRPSTASEKYVSFDVVEDSPTLLSGDRFMLFVRCR